MFCIFNPVIYLNYNSQYFCLFVLQELAKPPYVIIYHYKIWFSCNHLVIIAKLVIIQQLTVSFCQLQL